MTREPTCHKCGRYCEVIKTGFYHRQDNGLTYTGDLFGCLACGHFQLHGIPSRSHIWDLLFGTASGLMEIDPKNKRYMAMLNPVLTVAPVFQQHMNEWYPNWGHPLPPVKETTQ